MVTGTVADWQIYIALTVLIDGAIHINAPAAVSVARCDVRSAVGIEWVR